MKCAKTKYLFLILSVIMGFSFNTQSQSITEIARKGISSTVSIVALDKNMQPLGLGSGFIIDNQTIVTNVHVVEGASKVYVLKNNEATKYDVKGFSAIDRTNDLVVLKVDKFYGLAVKLGSEDMPEIGLRIYAIGNPKGLNGTFSEGIVSGIRDFSNRQVIQITAPISPGSSGGPILNGSGQVVGVAFGGYSKGQNLNFAIPVKYVIGLLEKQTTVKQVSLVKKQTKTQTSTNSNIKEGVQVRNIKTMYEDYGENGFYFHGFSFSVKNNLPYVVSDIRILFLVYDREGITVDSFEGIFFRKIKSFTGIKPYLARTFDSFKSSSSGSTYDGYEHKYENSQYPSGLGYRSGYKIKARVLDFRINE